MMFRPYGDVPDQRYPDPADDRERCDWCGRPVYSDGSCPVCDDEEIDE